MAQMYFKYGAMKSGKSNQIIMTLFNYESQNKGCLVFSSSVDTRSGYKEIESRMGKTVPCEYINDDVFDNVLKVVNNPEQEVYAVLVDEAQFLTRQDVENLTRIVDELNIPVICYGLKTDFQNKLFTGSKAMLELADKIEELKTICFYCNKKATMNMRFKGGEPVIEGESIQVGDEEYEPVCRRCYRKEVGKV